MRRNSLCASTLSESPWICGKCMFDVPQKTGRWEFDDALKSDACLRRLQTKECDPLLAFGKESEVQRTELLVPLRTERVQDTADESPADSGLANDQEVGVGVGQRGQGSTDRSNGRMCADEFECCWHDPGRVLLLRFAGRGGFLLLVFEMGNQLENELKVSGCFRVPFQLVDNPEGFFGGKVA